MKKKGISHKKVKSIRLKLTGAFLIPAGLIVGLGILSAEKATEAITVNYKEAIKNTIEKTADYYEILFQTVDMKSRELSTDNTVRSYYDGVYVNDRTRESDTYNQVAGKVRAAVNNENIGLACLTASYGSGVSTKGSMSLDAYRDYIVSEEGEGIIEAGENGIWSSRHSFLDEQLGISMEDYGLSISRPITGNSMTTVGILILDIKKKSIQAPMQTLEFPEGSSCAFVTPEGREITIEGENAEPVFSGTSFYEEAVGMRQTGLKELELNNEKFIYVYSPIGETGCMLQALIPKAMVTARADEIKGLTYMFVIIAIIIAIATGMILAFGIGRAIQDFNKAVEKAAEGDLTVSVHTKRKDEFSLLGKYLGNMFAGIERLVRGAAKVSHKVLYSAETVSGASDRMVNVSKEISDVIEKMERGLEKQALDAQRCLHKMELLEEKIENVSEETGHITEFAENTKKCVDRGIIAIGELEGKANKTSEVTNTIIHNIEELKEKTSEIVEFTRIIEGIARQTNLLSLNASIEAARVGEAGKGFGVVADEIRKLAENSMKASVEIGYVVSDIGQMTDLTTDTAREAKKIVEEQTIALQNTVEAFEDIVSRVEGMSVSIEEITDDVNAIADAKEVTKEAIESINEVLQQSAATVSQVQASAMNQVSASKELSREAESLTEQSKELGTIISRFTIASSEADTVSE